MIGLVRTIREIREILPPSDQRALVVASVLTAAIAMLDMLAIALVLPLVTLASGGDQLSGAGQVFSRILGESDPQSLVVAMAVVVVTLFILKDVGATAFNWWLIGFRVLKRVELSTRLLGKYLGTPYTEVSQRSSSELLRTMNDAVMEFYGSTIFSLMRLVSAWATLLAIGTALMLSAPLLSLALGAYFTLASVFYLRVMKPRSRRAGTVASDSAREAYQTALGALGGIKEAQLRGGTGFFVDAYREAGLRGAYALRTSSFITELPRYVLEILFIVAVGGLLTVDLTRSSADASAGVGVIALFVAAGLRALPAVSSVIVQVSNIRFGAGFLQVVLDEVRSEGATPVQGEPATIMPFSRELALRDVSFTYPTAVQPTIRGVSLTVPHGSSVAIVGSSGAGKTTLVDLMLGLHLPTSGLVSVDGVDIRDNLAGWQRSIGYVPQEIFLREGSLAENIAFDQPEPLIDRGRLDLAVQRAQLSDVVDLLGEGLSTPIGERGARLSGGQRQRIGIARALYRAPQLLVLDEATSSLDSETEQRVSEAIRELHGVLTMVIVAHRLSTVRHADQVVLMDAGVVEARGSFDEVRRQSPRFARMVQLGSLD